MLPKPRSSSAAHLALAGAVVAGVLLALVVAASPQLHELLHHLGGSDSEHACLVATLQAGGLDGVLLVVMAVAPMLEIVAPAAPRDVAGAASFFLTCRVLEHAPPRGLLS